MSTMISELYDALRKAGVDEQLARDASRAVLAADTMSDLVTKADLAEFRAATKADLAEFRAATKADLAELRATTKADLAELRAKADLAEFRAATKADLADLRIEFAQLTAAMADLKTDLIKWNVGAMAVLTGIFAAIVRLG